MLLAAENMLHTKRETLSVRDREVALVDKHVRRMDPSTGEVQPRGCGVCQLLFGRHRGQQSETTAHKLEKASQAVQARVQSLQTRLQSMKAQARDLAAADKRPEAIGVLRRSKAVEKQLAVAQATSDALEQQVLVMEEAALQKEVSSALASSVKSVKKKTKTLLKDTENAVDGAVDMRDLSEDLGAALDGLRPTEALDDDDLLAELELIIERDGPAVASTASHTAAVSHAPSAGVVNPALYPAAPRGKREEKAGLLSQAG